MPGNLCSAIPALTERADEAVGHRSRHGGDAWTQHQGLPLALDAVAATIVEYPTCQQQKVTLSHQYNNVSQVNQPATW